MCESCQLYLVLKTGLVTAAVINPSLNDRDYAVAAATQLLRELIDEAESPEQRAVYENQAVKFICARPEGALTQ
jgi:hypothetical protein